jgi:glycyl-tRNA synthetase alpha chain
MDNNKSKPYFFQDIILELKKFWSQRGCIILHSHDEQVGAGTLSPFTTISTLKNDEWNCCYEQYSRRPTDGRFGENPNRLCGYYQFQVILKPSPSDVLDIYLQSLDAIGINIKQNDIRFVEDDWQNPSIGASGLGWEVWLNGMEATQFTYMKQIGGIAFDKIPAEITYGVERLAMCVQGKDNIFDLEYAKGIKYKDVFYDIEVDYSNYYQKQADTELIFNYFNDACKEVVRLCDLQNTYAAFEFCLKASNYLNILDARGVLSQNQRASYILQIRDLVKSVLQNVINQK